LGESAAGLVVLGGLMRPDEFGVVVLQTASLARDRRGRHDAEPAR
jgi:hypothetical protein